MPAISKEQLDTIVNQALTERDRVVLNLLWHSGMRLSEVASVNATDFNWQEGTVIILGKGNRYRKALAGNRIVMEWFEKNDDIGITTRGIQTMLQGIGQAIALAFSKEKARFNHPPRSPKNQKNTKIQEVILAMTRSSNLFLKWYGNCLDYLARR